ncbi:MFS transporter [Mycobacterium sp.]|uniref:MFS transporter n=1 Tax=Mycobacterium sp. TaxID=1785 RepID=UPI003BA9A869
MVLIAQFRSLPRASRILMMNQFGINLGFYMLMPYWAAYLAGSLGLAAWAIGMVMGIRNFSEQGMFIIGGTLADRIGYKEVIVAGCLLRTGGFALLVFAQSLPVVLIAAAATGLTAALFNPAIRAYLAADTGDRRVEAFAIFNIFYQAGILLGPLIGLALVTIDFRLSALSAAVLSAGLTAAQLMILPRREADPETEQTSTLREWRAVIGNPSFLLFAVVMTGSYVLSSQIFLAMPLEASRLAPNREPLLLAALFVASGLVAVAAQLHITSWLAARWNRGRSLAIGVTILAASFLPLAIAPDAGRFGVFPALAALVASAAMLAVGAAAVFPFEMDTVVSLAGGQRVATHYGFYNTIVGTGLLVGNLAIGVLADAAPGVGMGKLVWAGLVLVGSIAALALHILDRRHHFKEPSVESR